MLFLYGELMVLLVVAFGVGAALAAVLMRVLVKERPPVLAAADHSARPTDGGGTP